MVLKLNLLGEVRICLEKSVDSEPRDSEVRLPGLESSKPGALLIYLAVEAGRSHARQSLAELLWSDRSQVEAHNSLRFALSNLRTALQDRNLPEPFILADRHQVRLNPRASTWVDVVEFEQQAAAFEKQAAVGLRPPVQKLQAALNLYQGSFLSNFKLGDSLPFESWVLNKGEQMTRHHTRLLQILAITHESAGNYAQAEEAYRTILAKQPWNEEAHRFLIRLLAAGGQRWAALGQYEACRQALMNELGVEPERETTLLYEEIKRIPSRHSSEFEYTPEKDSTSATSEAQPADSALPSTHPGESLFVARENELSRLEVFLQHMLAGKGQVVLITGEAGSGKTALLREFCLRALTNHPDLLAVGGQCSAYTGLSQPYLPFIESLQMLAGDGNFSTWMGDIPAGVKRLEAAAPLVAQTLVEKAPALLDRFVDRGSLASTSIPVRQEGKLNSTALDSRLLFEQVSRLLLGVSRRYPLILALDDLHWIDSGSAALLFHLARRISAGRVLILAAYRPGEIADQMLNVITELQRQGGDISIDLDKIDQNAFVAAYLQRDPLLQPHRLEESFQTALARHTGGNPLFTIEILRSLQARGNLRREQDGTWVNTPDLDWIRLPERVEAAIAGRIARLSPEWRDWLSTASVEGDSFTAEAVARVHSLDPHTLVRDLSGPLGMAHGAYHLVQAEGVQWVHAGGPEAQARPLSIYRFTHILFQTYLYQSLDQVERSRRHATLGQALEALYGEQPGEISRPDFDPHAASLAWHFEVGGLPARAAYYHLQAGKRAVFLGAAPTAIEHYQRGLELLDSLPPDSELPIPEQRRLEIELNLALTAPFILTSSGWGGPERQVAIQRALDLFKETGTENEWFTFFLALYAQADALHGRNELPQAAQLGEQMLAMAMEHGGLALALAYFNLGLTHLFRGNPLEGRRSLENSLSVYQAAGEPPTMALLRRDLKASCLAFMAIAQLSLGYPDQAQKLITQAYQRAQRFKSLLNLAGTLLIAGYVAGYRGEFPNLLNIANELLEVSQAEEMRFFQAVGLTMKGYGEVMLASERIPICDSTQASAGGMALIQQGMQLLETTGTRATHGLWVSMLATACLQSGQFEAGLAHIEQVLAPSANFGIAGNISEIYRLRGELLLRRAGDSPGFQSGARQEAEACFLHALQLCRQKQAYSSQLRVATSLARLWEFEKPVEARQLLEETCAWFSEGWETRDWKEAQKVLQDLSRK